MTLMEKQKLILVSAALALAGACGSKAGARAVTISNRVNGSTLTVSVNPQVHAGAIDSLVFRGVEYVDNHDHGRQIQSAIQVDNLGECFNPTEAGSRGNEAARKTSSIVRMVSNAGNVLRTETRPAFWLAPREPYGKACSQFRRESSAQNQAVVSTYTITRATRFYGAAIPNLLLVDVAMTMPEQRDSASIEALTAYLPRNFNTFYSYDPRSRRLEQLRAGTDGKRTTTPVIIATRDGRHAMGVYAPAITESKSDHAYYAYFYFSDGGATAKWSCVFGEFKIRAGTTFRYSCPIAVGSVQEVAAAFDAYAKTSR